MVLILLCLAVPFNRHLDLTYIFKSDIRTCVHQPQCTWFLEIAQFGLHVGICLCVFVSISNGINITSDMIRCACMIH